MYRCTRCGGKLNTGGLCPHCNGEYISIILSESPLLPSDYQQTIDALRAELVQVKDENKRLKITYNNLREQINNVNRVYWEYDDWGDKASEMKLSLEAILAMFPKVASNERSCDGSTQSRISKSNNVNAT